MVQLHLWLFSLEDLLGRAAGPFQAYSCLAQPQASTAEALGTCRVAMQHLPKHNLVQPRLVLNALHKLLRARSAEASVAYCRRAAV